ncbi:hypothetical protein [uncultured Gammaproteobacteria bacterium]|uniref:type II toxin-antitoxin system VapC family toxin n=1 Tax=Bathymodiolus heckerae thiotrophic gill symbiont TaxID=1052212 RepID=UPI0010B0C0A4|nr:type II toxin-antitoxin system VapC family toxin [Bathymodiolus heckerae thiotrophic gill symbiont]CAC9433685.1 hypothetical protein [uncultured Gammaproteobacteria bacterium]SMN13657.1 hypothetical protein BHECKSOX2_780 [Bathymodiolus heckerae thiotrophic gill symbiont]SMN15243.1 hypothetical protein CRYPD_448 [uncultured Candidatus Thioglobus sp.]
MNFVIDTHIFLWMFTNSKRINAEKLDILKNPQNNILLTNLSFWEIAIKYNIGKIKLKGETPDNLPNIAKELDLEIINIDAQIMANSYQLSPVEKHKDPFDRMLIWFCIQNNYTFMSNDDKLHEYEKQGLKWI